MAQKKEHKAQSIHGGSRWVTVEINRKVTFAKDGTTIGTARVNDEGHFVENTALLPDAVEHELTEKIRAMIDADYFD